MDYQLPMFQFGRCCACNEVKSNVRNFIALDLRAPQPGTGWGCVVCHLPLDGALAVVCDECKKKGAVVRWVICGPVWNGERLAIEAVTVKFGHHVHLHPELAEQEFRAEREFRRAGLGRSN